MNSINQFETLILKILESDPQLLVAASVVLLVLIVIGVFFVSTLRKLFSDESQAPPLSEKDRLKKLEELAKEEETLREQRNEAKLQKISEKEDSAKLELQEQEAQLRERQILQREIKAEEEEEIDDSPSGLLEQLKQGVRKTREQFLQSLGETLQGKKEIDEELLDDLEEVLLGADLGPETCQRVIEVITEKVERKELKDPEVLQQTIKSEISSIMDKQYPEVGTKDTKPLVLLMVGVNGVGKTTTIGKIAAQYVDEGKKVLLGAGDTFRAAAIEQLQQWADRAGCDIVSKEAGSDPSSVMYETVSRAVAEAYDVVICDTAGRLHTKKNLMEELKKMVRVIRKKIPEAPHQILLVLDASTGQNAIFQTREFLEATELTGLVITKLDGTSKGGVIIGIVNEFDIPVRYIGIGEQTCDLHPFDPKAFADSLFN